MAVHPRTLDELLRTLSLNAESDIIDDHTDDENTDEAVIDYDEDYDYDPSAPPSPDHIKRIEKKLFRRLVAEHFGNVRLQDSPGSGSSSNDEGDDSGDGGLTGEDLSSMAKPLTDAMEAHVRNLLDQFFDQASKGSVEQSPCLGQSRDGGCSSTTKTASDALVDALYEIGIDHSTPTGSVLLSRSGKSSPNRDGESTTTLLSEDELETLISDLKSRTRLFSVIRTLYQTTPGSASIHDRIQLATSEMAWLDLVLRASERAMDEERRRLLDRTGTAATGRTQMANVKAEHGWIWIAWMAVDVWRNGGEGFSIPTPVVRQARSGRAL